MKRERESRLPIPLLWPSCYCVNLPFCFCREASDADVQYAADIAAWFSKGKAEGKCPVVMASPTDIKKPKGAPPGKVMVSKESTIMGRPCNSVPAQEEST